MKTFLNYFVLVVLIGIFVVIVVSGKDSKVSPHSELQEENSTIETDQESVSSEDIQTEVVQEDQTQDEEEDADDGAIILGGDGIPNN